MTDTETHLYFIGADGLDFVKVGRSKNPQSRLRQLRSGSPYKLRLLRTYAAAGGLETLVLAALRARVEMNGEWFLCGDIDFDLLVEQAGHAAKKHRDALTEQQAHNGKGGYGSGLGREIKEARAGLGWKQQDLQAATGISQKYLSRVENDKADPSFSIVVRIAKALGMNLAIFCTEEQTNG